MVFDEEKYDTIVKKFQSKIYTYANYHLFHEKSFAEKVTNDVFVVLFKKWDKVGHLNNEVDNSQ
jgi:hypothetical protein